MQKDKLDLLLQELYSWNPKLEEKEAELIKLIESMAEAKPDTKFDEVFAADLKKDLLSHRILLDNDDGLKDNNLFFNFKSMNKKIYIAVGSVAVLGVAILAIMLNAFPKDKISFINGSKSNQFVKAQPGAFGSLALLTSNNSNSANQMAKGAAAVPATSEMSSARTVASVDSLAAPAVGMGGGNLAYKMIVAPMHSYKYVYKGEPLNLTESSGTVYRRIKGDGNLSSNLDSLISTKAFGPIDLGKFSNLRTSSISLLEDKKLGLNINIDFNEESVSIYQNWQQWQSDRDKCGDDQACWDSYRIKIDNVPGDDVLINKAASFLSEKGINLEHYGAAKVDNNWRLNYEASTDKANYYIPEEMSVIYPLVVDGQEVYDQSGNPDGLRVSVNLLQNAVSGVSNLNSYRYETSDYTLETDASKILGLAEKGGYGSGIFYASENQDNITLELGTPSKSLIRLWRYTNNTNEELLIPALIFPINNVPADYYGSKYITVPLVQEMVTELSNNNSGGIINGGGIMPMVK